MRAVAFVVVLASAACGGGSKSPAAPAAPVEPVASTAPAAEPAAAPPPPQTEFQRGMAKMREFESAMCACADEACARVVADDMTAWSQAEAKRAREPYNMSEAEIQEATQVGRHMGECMKAIMDKAAGSGSTGNPKP